MAIFDFLRRKNSVNDTGPTTNQEWDIIMDELTKLNNAVFKIEKAQKEMILQLEEIDTVINEGAEELIMSVVEVADIVYDFYYFAQRDDVLKYQAHMMWDNAKKTLSNAEVDIIGSIGEFFNHNLHVIHDTVEDSNLPHEYITQMLKCGYIYKGKILRRAAVVVNKYVPTVDNSVEEGD